MRTLKWLVIPLVLSMTAFAAWWYTWRWPVQMLSVQMETGTPLVLGEHTRLTLTTNQPFEVTRRRGVEAIVTSPNCEVTHAKLRDAQGVAVFEFDVIPHGPLGATSIDVLFTLRDKHFHLQPIPAEVWSWPVTELSTQVEYSGDLVVGESTTISVITNQRFDWTSNKNVTVELRSDNLQSSKSRLSSRNGNAVFEISAVPTKLQSSADCALALHYGDSTFDVHTPPAPVWKWPVREWNATARLGKSAVVGEPYAIQVHTNQLYQRTDREHVVLKVEGDGIEFREAPLYDRSGQAAFSVELIPLQATESCQLRMYAVSGEEKHEIAVPPFRVWKWPVEGLTCDVAFNDPLVVDERGKFTIKTNQSFASTDRNDVSVHFAADGITVEEARLLDQGGLAVFEVDVMPKRPLDNVAVDLMLKCDGVSYPLDPVNTTVWSWPVGELKPELDAPVYFISDETARLVLATNQLYERTKRNNVAVKCSSEHFSTVDTRLLNKDGRATFEIDLVPTKPNASVPLTLDLVFGEQTIPVSSQDVTIWSWPVGEFDTQFEIPDLLLVGQPAKIVIRTNQEFERTQRKGVTLELKTNGITVQESRLVNQRGVAAFEVDIVPERVGQDVESKLALLVDGQELSVQLPKLSVWSWPIRELETTLEQPLKLYWETPATITIVTNQPTEQTRRETVELAIQSKSVEVLEWKLADVNGNAVFLATVIPKSLGLIEDLVVTINHQDAVYPVALPAIQVEPPGFYSRETPTFAGLIGAPDLSIYGAHITQWQPPTSELLMVTGHAATNVCRVASAVLFELARHSDIDSDHFVLGAGVASLDLSELQNDVIVRRESLAKDYPEIWRKIEALVDEERSLNKVLDELCNSLDMNVRKEFTAVDQDLLMSPDLQLDIISAKRKTPQTLEDDELQLLEDLLAESETAVAAYTRRELARFTSCTDCIDSLSDNARNEFVRQLDELTRKAKALDTQQAEFKSLREETGLLRLPRRGMSTIHKPEVVDKIRQRLAEWIQTASVGQRVPLARLSAGHRGCILLPYFEANGREVRFSLEDSLLTTSAGIHHRNVVRNTTALELLTIAENAINRWRQAYSEAQEFVVGQAQALALLDNGGKRRHLSETREVTIRLLDEKGQVVGQKVVAQTVLELIVSRWEFASDSVFQRKFFERLRDSIQDVEDDEVFGKITDRCLIDSILRGWDLAFSDSNATERYDEWMTSVRNAAWSSIAEQARQQDIDLRQLINEATVFAVRESSTGFDITPMAVADVEFTWCVQGSDMTSYSHPWQHRMARMLSGDLARDQTPSAYACELSARVIEEIADLTSKGDVAENPAVVAAPQESAARWKAELEAAMNADPEQTTAELVDAILDFWPDGDVFSTDKKAAPLDLIGKMTPDAVRALKDQLGDMSPQARVRILSQLSAHSGQRNEAGGEARDVMALLRAISWIHEARRCLDDWRIDDRINRYVSRIKRECLTFPVEGSAGQHVKRTAEALESILNHVDRSGDLDVSEIEQISACLKFLTDCQWEDDRAERHFRQRCEDIRFLVEVRSSSNSAGDGQSHAVQFIKRAIVELASCEKLAPTRERIEALTDLSSEIARSQLDALDRHRIRRQLAEEMSSVGAHALEVTYRRMKVTPNRFWIECFTQMSWHTGRYQTTIDRLLAETDEHLFGEMAQLQEQLAKSDSEEEKEALSTQIGERKRRCETFKLLSFLIRSFDESILKACVYSGDEFFGASLFGRRGSEWVKQPTTLQEVVEGYDIVPGNYDGSEAELLQQCAKAYDAAVRGELESDTTNVTIGPYRVLAVHKSFTDVRAFHVVDEYGSESIIKIRQLNEKNRSRVASEIGVSEHLARHDVSVALTLPLYEGSVYKQLEGEKLIVTRETMASGVQMSELAMKNGGTLNQEQQELYVRAALDMAVKAAGMPDGIGFRPAVRRVEQMRQRLEDRGVRGKMQLELFVSTKYYQDTFGAVAGEAGQEFYNAYTEFIESLWGQEGELSEVGFVHDAILPNLFLDKEMVLVIDVGDDYVGSVGHVVSILVTQLQPVGQAWTYEQYKSTVESILNTYQQITGRSLSQNQVTEIIQHLSYHPYKFLSADSSQFLSRLCQLLNIPETELSLKEASQTESFQDALQELFDDPQLQEKYSRLMQQIEYSLRMLEERIEDPALQQKILRLREAVQRLREQGIRVAAAKQLREDALAVVCTRQFPFDDAVSPGTQSTRFASDRPRVVFQPEANNIVAA